QVKLTMGGEPTYISATNQDFLQWRYSALGEDKRRVAGQLLKRLQKRLTPPGSLLHDGLGKLYPGELTPRWALGCFWRLDGKPLWHNPDLIGIEQATADNTWHTAKTFITELLPCFALPPEAAIAAFESDETEPKGFVLPLLTTEYQGKVTWRSCQWTGCEERLILLPGDSALGLRLPLNQLPNPETFWVEAIPTLETPPIRPPQQVPLAVKNSIRLALTVEVRRGTLHVFMPPIASARSYVDVLTAIEATAEALDQPIILEGYAPPSHQGIQGFQITPDPGVLEVNTHPAANWPDLVHLHKTLDEEAIACDLTCEKHGMDGRLLGTGGGAHITLGGPTPETSPLLQRPDLLRSFITYWQQHPSLSYAFSGQFIGPTSQSPRVDEGRHDSLYELELAFLALSPREQISPEVLDRLLSPWLQDMTGNAHRTALCIDKLFPVNNPQQQLGLLELRGFEMPAHTGLRLLQMLLIRALVAWFWRQPCTSPLKRWGATLRDRWRLPHYLKQDFHAVLKDLQKAGYPFQAEWFAPFWERRFPQYGKISLIDNPSRKLEIRAALEPWPVIGHEDSGNASRLVDNSLERVQIFLTGAIGDQPEPEALSDRYVVLCNGHRVPMRSTGTPGDYVGGVRFRARSALGTPHPIMTPHAPLVCQVIDTWQSKFLGGAIYHVQPSSGEPYRAFPETPEEARSRLAERFVPLCRGTIPPQIPSLILHPETPMTLDLRLVSQKTEK
ncbi:MAG: transglutaminase-like family protein, partial [Leptolyngbya sp. SIO1D8]|nr:transglutaminase-like family protein [Leptolyngbya sp. SIO1D8]